MAESKKEINILLIGETGVGKSTFINSFVNYLTFETLEEAKSKMIYLIPTAFQLQNTGNVNKKWIRLGSEDRNESFKVGDSATKMAKSYTFDFGTEYVVRLIDTPGIGDTSGVKQDRENLENILFMIGQYRELHAICFLFKPTQSRLTTFFEFCVKQLLAHLEKSASKNIVFLFTNTRGTDYEPGQTSDIIQEILKKIQESTEVCIPFDEKTVYCLDNEAFRYLAANQQDFQFNARKIKNFAESWEQSAKESARLMSYIIGTDDQPGLKPHKVADTICVNEARRMILAMSRPLAEIIQINEENKKLAKDHKRELEVHSEDIEYLRSRLYIPTVELDIEERDQPATVCSSAGCCTEYKVSGLTKFHYTSRCHDPCDCSLTGWSFWWCKSMEWGGSCKNCGCDSSKHLHIYYDSNTVEKRIVNEEIDSSLQRTEQIKENKEQMIKDLNERINKITVEVEFITEASAKFAAFLKYNAISPYNDSFERHLLSLIESADTVSTNPEINTGMKTMLDNYILERTKLDSALQDAKGWSVSTDEVFRDIERLKNLEISGDMIADALEKEIQGKARQMSSLNAEVRHVSKGKQLTKAFLNFFKNK